MRVNSLEPRVVVVTGAGSGIGQRGDVGGHL